MLWPRLSFTLSALSNCSSHHGSCPSRGCRPGTSFNYFHASVVIRRYNDEGGAGAEILAELPVCWDCTCDHDRLVGSTTGSYAALPAAPNDGNPSGIDVSKDAWVVATVLLANSSASGVEDLALDVTYESAAP